MTQDIVLLINIINIYGSILKKIKNLNWWIFKTKSFNLKKILGNYKIISKYISAGPSK